MNYEFSRLSRSPGHLHSGNLFAWKGCCIRSKNCTWEAGAQTHRPLPVAKADYCTSTNRFSNWSPVVRSRRLGLPAPGVYLIATVRSS